MIRLQSITWDNFWDVIKLTPQPNQEKYIESISLFMSQSYVNLKEGYPDKSLAIYNNMTLIGFTKIVLVPKDIKPYFMDNDAYMIDAFIIDQSQQGNGYGKKAFSKIIEFCKSFPFGPVKDLTLVCYEDNIQAQSLFSKYGFVKIKEVNKIKKMSLYRTHL